jgi:hypothetical protein
MKRFIIVWIALMALISTALGGVRSAQAGDITVCRDTSVEWPRYRFSGIDWNADTLFYVADGASAYGDTLIADALTEDNGDGIVFAGEAFVAYYLGDGEWFTLKGTPDTAPCGGDEGNGWQPGAVSIYIPMTSDCAFVEIRDTYGHWSQVTSDGEPVLLHYGEALIGGQNQSTDPADYRAIPTACY